MFKSFFQNEINILVFKGNVTHTVLHQNDMFSSIQDVIFGVAILDEKKVSSGIRWQDPCIYKKDSGIVHYCKKIYTHLIAMIQTFFTSAEPKVLRFYEDVKSICFCLLTFSSLRIGFSYIYKPCLRNKI